MDFLVTELIRYGDQWYATCEGPGQETYQCDWLDEELTQTLYDFQMAQGAMRARVMSQIMELDLAGNLPAAQAAIVGQTYKASCPPQSLMGHEEGEVLAEGLSATAPAPSPTSSRGRVR